MGLTRADGPAWRVVTVEEVTGAQALCRDDSGKTMIVRTDLRRGGGPAPRQGERWILDRALGRWTFVASFASAPPTITGSRGGNAALANLLASLEALGLIINDTS